MISSCWADSTAELYALTSKIIPTFNVAQILPEAFLKEIVVDEESNTFFVEFLDSSVGSIEKIEKGGCWFFRGGRFLASQVLSGFFEDKRIVFSKGELKGDAGGIKALVRELRLNHDESILFVRLRILGIHIWANWTSEEFEKTFAHIKWTLRS